MDSLKEKYDFRVLWEPFLLRPNMPPEGIPKPEQYTDPKNPRIDALKEAGKTVGIDFTYKCKNFPNTLKAHALLEYVKEKFDAIKQNEASELLFKAYFTDGHALTNDDVLEVGSQLGIKKDDLSAYINNEAVINGVRKKAQQYSQQGVTGVPFFYMNGQQTFSGAQEPESFKHMFQVISEKFPVSSDQSEKKSS